MRVKFLCELLRDRRFTPKYAAHMASSIFILIAIAGPLQTTSEPKTCNRLNDSIYSSREHGEKKIIIIIQKTNQESAVKKKNNNNK